MGIGPRILLALVVPIVIVIAVLGYVDQRRSRQLLKGELMREGRAIARIAQLSVEDALRDRQLGDMRELVDQITGYERVLGMRIFDQNGSLVYESAVLNAHPFIHDRQLANVLRGRTAIETHRVIGAEPVVTFIVPLTGNKKETLGAVQILQLESFIEEDARSARNFTLLLTGAVVLVIGIIVVIATDVTVRRPVEDLVHSFQTIEAGQLVTARVPVRRHDELGRLAMEFNNMCARLEEAERALSRQQDRLRAAEARLRRAEHMASIGRLAAGLAHEIGTPLGVIKGRAESLLHRTPVEDTSRRSLQIIAGQIDRIARILRATLDFARSSATLASPVDVGDIVKNVVDLLDDRFRARQIGVQVQVSRGLAVVDGNADRLSQVFLNLAVNAVDAMPSGGTLRINVQTVAATADADANERARVRVTMADTGIGISPENLDRILEPFFTTKDVGEGSGLGLSISYGIIQEHGGWLEVESTVGRGSTFVVNFPLSGTDDSLRATRGADS
jgi:two-component system, NtrC family, sensor kinase